MKHFCNLLLRSDRVDPSAVLGGQKETHKSLQTENSIPALHKQSGKKQTKKKKKLCLLISELETQFVPYADIISLNSKPPHE